MNLPKISFGIIVLNGEPFTRYCLRQLYPFAHQIIVAEGAVEGAESIATSDGHSIDGTYEVLKEFKREEDPENKLIIVDHCGFWQDKHDQSRAYSEFATGDYLWQVDIDEFYRSEDLQCIMTILYEKPDITAVSFPTITFWGNPQYRCDSWMLRNGSYIFHRLFKWADEYVYSTHTPPTVLDNYGQDLRTINHVDGKRIESLGIRMYHYSLLFPRQVEIKGIYYSNRKNRPQVKGWKEWMKNSYLSLNKPFRTHNVFKYPGWLERYYGKHPEQIVNMWNDIESGAICFPVRQTEDVEKIIDSFWYIAGILALKTLNLIDRLWNKLIWNRIKWFWKHFKNRG